MIHIYVSTHKAYEFPKNPIYIPIQVGRALHDDLGYLPDNRGDNISEKNPYYSELTGIYWAWKNDREADIKGLCHYRRYLMNDQGHLWNEKEIRDTIGPDKPFDIISTKLIKLNYSYYDAFSVDHNAGDLDALAAVVKEKHPEDYAEYEAVVHGSRTYFGNIFICPAEIFDEYASWLFDILFELEKRIDPSKYDGYEKRVYGFLSEVLLLVFIRRHDLRVKECKVAMMGEKKETAEMKDRIAGFFRAKDPEGARKYFMEGLKKKPDLLMETSDIYGELKLCMQMISTAEYEIQSEGRSFLEKNNDLDELIAEFRELNNIMQRKESGLSDEADEKFLRDHDFSKTALEIAEKIAKANKIPGSK
ncbi:DUF4422 domain-containing protein [Lachnospiraceae bacterium C1.1]|nr:DUF4422 domain-containing protein [Lachnospiraceae bacterium C1.1]